MSGMAGAKIEDLRIVWADEKMLRGLLEQAAQSQGMTLDQLKAGVAQALPALEAQMTGDLEKQVLAAAKTVLDKVDDVTITIVADPAEPYPLAGFLALAMGPGGMPDFGALAPLNLSIEAE
jgi:bifunctional ADP-heptose synthase (sugar kinase/adenylyltransferase)